MGGKMPRHPQKPHGISRLVAAFIAGIVFASWGPLHAQGLKYTVVKAASVKPLVKSSIGCGIKVGIWLDFDNVLQLEYNGNTYLLDTQSGEGCKV
jgi:hypothetical protein